MTRPLAFLMLLSALTVVSTHGLAQRGNKRKIIRRSEQLFQGPQWQVGFSFGGGGQQFWIGPSVDVHYGDFTLRTVPGLTHVGGGIQYRFGPRVYATDCVHRPVYLSLGYLNDWALAPILRGSESTLVNQDVLLLMAGMRHNLNYRGTVFLEWGIGLSQLTDLRRAFGVEGTQRFYSPMAEVRIGLIQPRPPKRYGR